AVEKVSDAVDLLRPADEAGQVDVQPRPAGPARLVHLRLLAPVRALRNHVDRSGRRRPSLAASPCFGLDLLLRGGEGADRAGGQVVPLRRAELPAEVDDLQVPPVPGLLREGALQV